MKKYVGAIIGALIIVLAFAMFWTNGTHDRATRKQRKNHSNFKKLRYYYQED